jgi:rhamnulokinase
MANHLNMIAADLGASSGRVVLGGFDGEKISIRETNRFHNIPVGTNGTLYWDILYLYREIRQGFKIAANEAGNGISSIGIDTWGNDFGLLDRNGRLLSNPVHYRDNRTLEMMEKVFEKVPRDSVFKQTGIQFMRLNGLYQLFSMFYNQEPPAKMAETLLLIPDLLVYFLTGVKMSEFTNATTTQMFNPNTMDWARELLCSLGVNEKIFTGIVRPGTIIGKLTRENAVESGLKDTRMVAVAEHDTGSAVVAVPADGEDFVYISSGTWSLMGVEERQPVINDLTFQYNFTNEGGVFGTFRLLKNVMGLWIVQECKRYWDNTGEEYSYAQLEDMAWRSEPFKCFIDPDDDLFLNPGDMPLNIARFCRETGQKPPETIGQYVRCIMESLALKYRYVLDRIEEITGKIYDTIHIVGGGAKDGMLCSFIASAAGIRVVAGPVEATAIGNIAVQAMALGEIGSLREARQIIRNSFPVKVYVPEMQNSWNDAYAKFMKLVTKRKISPTSINGEHISRIVEMQQR